MALIPASDYNEIQSKIESVMGPGTSQRGYGQTLFSQAITPGTIISAMQYDSLRYDIVNIKSHQDGTNPFIRDIAQGDVIGIGAGDPKQQYGLLADICIQNKFNIATGQYAINNIDTKTHTTSWNTQLTATLTATFATANDARYFFNSGGKIRFTSSRSGGTASPQNNSWTSLLTAVGTQSFGADTDTTVKYYGLTDQYQQLYIKTASSSYSSNYFSIDVKSDVVDNSAGTARIITFRVKWGDPYVDPDVPPVSFGTVDIVDGTLTLVAEELKASGTLVPSGTFTVTSPTYSLSTITGS